jgi:hypothetical protein
MALFKQRPDTAVDAAAMQMLVVSLPDHVKNAVSRFATAYDAFHYILDKFTGGKNPEANLVWRKELEASMGWQPPDDPTASAAYPDYKSPTEAYEDDGDDEPDPPPLGEIHLEGPCVMSLPAAASPSRAWMVDSGASVHLISDLNMLLSPWMHSVPKPLHLASSDAVGGIIAGGSLCLADARGRKLWLHNVQCAPAANMNLISVSAAIRDGCRFGTDLAGAYIRMTGPHAWSSPVLLKRG